MPHPTHPTHPRAPTRPPPRTPTTPDPVSTVAEVAEVVQGAGSLALACHHHPDGDALGSMLAMHLLCEANGVPSVASWPSPWVVAPHYEFLPGLDRCSPPSAFPSEPDVLVTFEIGRASCRERVCP